jgi:large subunit ribosomal protein L30
MKSILVVNLHGLINVPEGKIRALRELHVERRFSAAVIKDSPSMMGLLKLCKDYVAWSPIEKDLLTLLLRERGRVSKRRRLDEGALKSLGFKDHAKLTSKIMKDGALSSMEGLKPFFTLSSPKGGFKRSTRRQYAEGGVLGRNPDLPELVRRMI